MRCLANIIGFGHQEMPYIAVETSMLICIPSHSIITKPKIIATNNISLQLCLVSGVLWDFFFFKATRTLSRKKNCPNYHIVELDA